MKYWQNFKSRLDRTANDFISAGAPGYTSLSLICLTIVVTVLFNYISKLSSKRYLDYGEVDNSDALS